MPCFMRTNESTWPNRYTSNASAFPCSSTLASTVLPSGLIKNSKSEGQTRYSDPSGRTARLNQLSGPKGSLLRASTNDEESPVRKLNFGEVTETCCSPGISQSLARH